MVRECRGQRLLFGGEKNQREIREIGMVKEVRGRLLRSKEVRGDERGSRTQIIPRGLRRPQTGSEETSVSYHRAKVPGRGGA